MIGIGSTLFHNDTSGSTSHRSSSSHQKRYRSELEKEKSAHGPLNAKIAALEKELKAEKKQLELLLAKAPHLAGVLLRHAPRLLD